MQKKTIWKDTFREIKRSATRFLAILLIILIGVAFFVGISATGPDMMTTIRHYFTDQNLMDHKIVSTYGLEQEDINLLGQIEGVKVQPHYTADILIQDTQDVLRLYSYDLSKGQKINQYTVTEGRLPENPGEIALDDTASIRSHWSIGDQLAIDWEAMPDLLNKPLHQTEYKVVGFVRSPLFIEHISRGHTNVGGGSLNGFGVIAEEDFALDVYTEAYLNYSQSAKLTAYTDAYQALIDKQEEKLEKAFSKRKEDRYNRLVSDIKQSVTDGEQEIAQAKKQLSNAKHQLVRAEMDLQYGRKKLAAGYHDFYRQINAARERLEEHQSQLTDEEMNLKDHIDLLNQSQKDLDNGKKILDEKESELQTAYDSLQQLKQAQAEINQGFKELQKAQDELNEATKQLPELEKALDMLETFGLDYIPATTRAELQSKINDFEEQARQLKQRQENLETERQKVKQIKDDQESLSEILKRMNDLRVDELDGRKRSEVEAQITKNEKTIQSFEQAESALASAQSELNKQRPDIQKVQSLLYWMDSQQINALPELSQTDIRQKIATIKQGQNELNNRWSYLNGKQAELDKAQEKLSEDDIQNGLQLLKENRQKLTDQQNELDKAWSEVTSGQEKLNQGKVNLQDGEDELEKEHDAGRQQLAQSEEDLEAGTQELQKGQEEFSQKSAEAEKEISSGEADLQKAREKLDHLPELDYYIFDRTDNPGYSEYKDNAARMQAIAGIFPVFFFFIAILISLTTMTRMVDEEREYIGTMKALGYRNNEIIIKFITYAFLATIIGAILGLMLGYQLFPRLIFNAYSSLYNIPPIIIQSYPVYTLLALIGAFVSTVGATMYAVHSSLKSKAADLLRPKAPKKGTHILLEKIPGIWKRLSFNYKITLRNVFRYKTRMMMTIFGIAGSTALILTGFGISDSISDIPKIQYNDINQFQAYVALDTSASPEEKKEYQETITHLKDIKDSIGVLQESLTIKQKGVNTQKVTMMVPENPDHFHDFVQLLDANSQKKLSLPEEGVLITQKLAELLKLKVGDTLTAENTDGQEWSMKVASIVQNYVGHFIYAKPSEYTGISGYTPEVTQNLIKYAKETNEEKLGETLMEQKAVIGLSYVSDIYQAFMDTITSLDLITHVLVISAALLTLIVLYNLTNINVAERIRELSTIKVLGFYDHEVTRYVYRENWILTFLGIITGFIGGWFLHQFLIRTTEVDLLLFSRRIDWTSYLYSAILVIAFSLIVLVIIHRRLKRIDMVEALKGGE